MVVQIILFLPVSRWEEIKCLLQKAYLESMLVINQWCFTYVVSFKLHSVAEDKSVKVGLLEDLIKRSLVLKFRKKFNWLKFNATNTHSLHLKLVSSWSQVQKKESVS